MGRSGVQTIKWIFWAAALVLLYWVYLFFTTRMEVAYDSIDYLRSGELIARDGLPAYVQQGPGREPLYPLLIALAVKTAQFLSSDLLAVLKFYQLVVLAVSLFLFHKLLGTCRVNDRISALLVFYMGISPAIVNSALSVYSEILSYPFLLGGGFFLSRAFSRVSGRWPQSVGVACVSGVFLFLLTMVKGVFEVTGWLFLLGALAAACWKARETRPMNMRRVIIALAAGTVLTSGVHLYKYWNDQANGHYVLTNNRVVFSLYGNASRRAGLMTPERWRAGVAFVPGRGACEKFFSKEDCFYWDFESSDIIGMARMQELNAQGLSDGKVQRIMLSETAKAVSRQPAQYIFFSAVEFVKAFFWETTRLGFVVYPKPLAALFGSGFNDGLRMLVACLSAMALAWGVRNLFRRQYSDGSGPEDAAVIMILALGLSLSFITILTRYVLPVAPLFLLLIGGFVSDLAGRWIKPKV